MTCSSQAYIGSLGLVKAPDALQSLTPPKQAAQAPPSHPDHQKPPPLAALSMETNPFTRRSMEHGLSPVQPADPERLPLQHTNKISQNPFLACDNGADQIVPPVNMLSQGKLPPLPPPKPMHCQCE